MLLDARLCALLAPDLRGMPARARKEGRYLCDELQGLVDDVDKIARAVRAASNRAGGTATAAIAAEEVSAMVGATEAAALLGVTTSNVRQRAARGTLPGVKQGDRWQFDPLRIQEIQDEMRTIR